MNISQWKNGDRTFFSLEVDDRLSLVGQSLIIEVLWFINPFLHCRWDLQRLREEQQLQKLRARQEKQILSLSGNKKDDASLLPNIEVCIIELTAVLVLNVFSHCRVQHT